MVLIVLITVIALTSIVIFLYKIRMKSKLSKGLGRPVEDHELTSISSWMEATPDKQENFKKYTPAKSQFPVDPSLESKDL